MRRVIAKQMPGRAPRDAARRSTPRRARTASARRSCSSEAVEVDGHRPHEARRHREGRHRARHRRRARHPREADRHRRGAGGPAAVRPRRLRSRDTRAVTRESTTERSTPGCLPGPRERSRPAARHSMQRRPRRQGATPTPASATRPGRRTRQALGELEGGEAVVFASGMGAVTTLLLTLLKAGERLVIPSDAYYTTRTLANDLLAVRRASRCPPTPRPSSTPRGGEGGLDRVALEPGPGRGGHPRRRGGAPRTRSWWWTTRWPRRWGSARSSWAPITSMASASKSLTGHSDLILGYVAAADRRAPGLAARRSGPIPGPFEVWLAHRSLATLDVRLERQCENAQRLARAARASDVTGVRYPGSPGDPATRLAKARWTPSARSSAFELPSDEAAARRSSTASELIAEATSFGGVHSTAERRARWGGDDDPRGFIRLSAGCEDPDDLARGHRAGAGKRRSSADELRSQPAAAP